MVLRKVNCSYLGKELDGLDKPPFSGPLGEKIFNLVSKEAFEEWKQMQIKIINEYRLDLSEAEDRQKLLGQMKVFLKLDEKNDKSKALKVGNPV